MAVNISISPKKVWKEAIEVANEFACFGSIALGIIAEDDERGIRVCMRHNDTKSDSDSVYIYAIENDTVVASKLTNSADECEKTVEEFLKKYLFKASKEDSDESLILQKILGVTLLALCIIATVVLHDFTILVFCAPFYLSGLFSKENVLCISENGQTAEVSNGSDISDKTNRQGCDKAV